MPENFFKVINRDEMKGKQTAAVVLANDNAYVVVSCRDKLFVVDAYSTVRTDVLCVYVYHCAGGYNSALRDISLSPALSKTSSSSL